MPIKISKAVKDLNIGMQTARDFLKKNEIEVDDNINARISDEAYNLLIQKFKPAMQQKKAAEQIIHDRKEEKAAQAAEKKRREAEESKTVEVAIQKPKVLGKIELDAKGNPVAPKTAAPEAPKAEEVKMEEKKAEEQKPAPAALPKEEAKPEPAAVEPKKEEKAPAEPKAEKPQPVAETPVVEQKKEEAPATAPQAEPEAISNTPRMQGPKVVGKIDLSALNQSTRPKKKTKEEKRNERINKEKARQGANADGEKRKRKRIGKEKVDIEKSVQQQSQGGGNQKRGNQQNAANAQNANAGKRNKKDKNKRPFKAEVSEEDVQRQMKETLARLTNKPQKKGAKWRREKREAFREEERAEAAEAAAESKILKLTEFVTANDLAAMMNVPINKVIGTCMSIGVMVSINQRLDAETINIVAEEFGYKTEYESADVAEQIHEEEDNPEDLESRPPVVTVMGHVDHGKTSLLDHIRNANVIAGEAGGITQHIGAYNVKLKNGRRITFLDTPGHEAFTAMRARGAKVTDIVIIIVAADDAVMPQTVEALNHASAAGVPIIFAINKIDKPGANPDKIKEELANLNYLVEEWGGKYQSQDISAKKGIGVAELLDKVLLEADMLELKANPHRKATGSIIESSLDKGRGYVATLLVDNGTLHVGDIILAGTHYGKVKAMFNERNQRIQEAGPSSPALILGLNGAPTAGDKFNVMDTDQEARQIANKREQLQRELGLRTQKRFTLEDIARRKALGEFHELNVIVKGDVDGSIEALSDSLLKLSTPEVQVNVVHKAVGAISESDVTLAAASNAYIIGFQVRPSADAKRLAAQEGVDIRIYSIIYDAIEEVKSAMEGMLAPDIKEEVIGNVMVKEVYHISKVGTIAGAMVMDGKIKRNCKVRVIRDGIVRYTGALASLKRFKDDVKEVTNGFECGLSIAGYNDILPDDMLEAFEEVEVQKSL
ncbi:MAG: translation initiation factor IF-2 [Sodaliphilus sp.]|nr:translation initiation factor IF-2 [Sodaliphilus sp.]MDY4733299.1 translation initiation factor IF-2 [Sodaliphilus sp.]MDY5010019.1 translation initiation factor IF-2 [Sodaliphilus sp.]MDY5952521.1 translation initiation factor IF-2 [Sodaliphilus sp.]